MRTWSIYTLADPRTPSDIRYVGVTHDIPERRRQKHVWAARRKRSSYSSKWIYSLLKLDLEPLMCVVETGSGDPDEAEIRWIRDCREVGHKLTNHQKGGRISALNVPKSPGTREKLAAANRGKKQSPELVEKRISKIRGKKHTDEARANMSAGSKGRKVSEEGKASLKATREATSAWRDKIAATNKATYAYRKENGLLTPRYVKETTEETREKLRVSHLGKVQSEETKAKRSESLKRSWAKRKAEGKGEY